MKNIKRLLGLNKIEVTEVLDNVLKRHSKSDNNKRLIDFLINDYKYEHKKLILAVILSSMFEDDLYTEIMSEIEENIEEIVTRIKGEVI